MIFNCPKCEISIEIDKGINTCVYCGNRFVYTFPEPKPPKSNRCWREHLIDVMKSSRESWGDVVKSSATDDELNQEHYTREGAESLSFYVWTKNYVYFPVNDDDSHYIDYVPRNPKEENDT